MEIEAGKFKPNITKKKASQLHSSVIASLKGLDPQSDDDDDEDDKVEGPMWKLFNHLYNAASGSGI